LTKQRWIDDTLELIDWLRNEFDQRKIIVVGQSWGTVLALEAARRYADRLHLVVLQGLAVEWLASAEQLRLTLIEEAKKAGDTAEAERLVEVGPVPPATDAEAVMAWVPRFGVPVPDRHTWHNIAGAGDGWGRRVDLLRYVSPDLPAEQYAQDKAGTLQAGEWLYARHAAGMRAAMTWNAPRDVGVDFEVPIVVMQGTHDWQTWTDIARSYFDRIQAPWKQWIEFPHAAHALNIEQPGLSVVSLVNAAMAAVGGRVPEGAIASGHR
jgi:pimeloyl-ACP methyl ester carboxylesterase